jgi:signal transduction histidine kinase
VLTYTRLLQSIKHTPYSSVRLIDVIKNAVKEHATTINAKNATINIDELPVISGVEKQLQQLFSSLISNSLKFIESEKRPEIRVSYTAAHPEELTTYQLDTSMKYIKIIYEDNGIGLDSRYSDYIFNLFRRLHTQEEFPGTGIGLALCRKIVENHQGKIFAAGRKGIGTVFTIFLPEKLETPTGKIISV